MEFNFSVDGVDYRYLVWKMDVQQAPRNEFPGQWELLAMVIGGKVQEEISAEGKLLILFRGSKKGAEMMNILINMWSGIPSSEKLEQMLAVSNGQKEEDNESRFQV